jgi:hypothetical protein
MESEINVKARTTQRGISFMQFQQEKFDVLISKKKFMFDFFQNNNIESKYGVKLDFFIEQLDLMEKEKASGINPICFIFSYIMLDKSNSKTYSINLQKFKDIEKKFKSQMKENKIEVSDLIRYCRLWTIVIFKKKFN